MSEPLAEAVERWQYAWLLRRREFEGIAFLYGEAAAEEWLARQPLIPLAWNGADPL